MVEANSITRTDVKLDVGDIEQSVTITSEAPALQTDRAETRSDVTTAELENLRFRPGAIISNSTARCRAFRRRSIPIPFQQILRNRSNFT